MGCCGRRALVLIFLVLTPPLSAQQAPRRPRGIYAVVNIEENIKKEQAANPSITPAELKAYFVNLYQDLLGNPAVSGLAPWVNWSALNPDPPAASNPYDWTYLDDALGQLLRGMLEIQRKIRKRSRLSLCRAFKRPSGYWLRFPVATACFDHPFRLLPARAER
jgi:hypothetical protein